MSRPDSYSDFLSVRRSSSLLSIGVLAAVLIVSSALLYHWKSTPAPVLGLTQSTPAAEDMMVLRLEKDGRFRLNGLITESTGLPPILKEHARRREGSAVLVELHKSLPVGAFLEVMQLVNQCGIKRTAVRSISD